MVVSTIYSSSQLEEVMRVTPCHSIGALDIQDDDFGTALGEVHQTMRIRISRQQRWYNPDGGCIVTGSLRCGRSVTEPH